jgi:hypothetical protein
VLRGQDRQKFVAFGSGHFPCHSSAHSMRELFFRIITISRCFGLTTGVEAVHATFVVMKNAYSSFVVSECPTRWGFASCAVPIGLELAGTKGTSERIGGYCCCNDRVIHFPWVYRELRFYYSAPRSA